MYVVVLGGYRPEPCLVVARNDYSSPGNDGSQYIFNSFKETSEIAKVLQVVNPQFEYSVKALLTPGEKIEQIELTYTKEDVMKILKSVGKSGKDEILPVRDGFVVKDSKVWWHSESGPQQVTAGVVDWENIRNYPDCYSIQEPEYEVVYKY